MDGQIYPKKSIKAYGFSLPEVLVAGLLFVMFSIPFFGLLSTAKRGTVRQTRRVEALFLAQGVIEELRHNSRERNTTMVMSISYKGMKIDKKIERYSPEDPRLFLATVTVSWEEMKKNMELSLSSIISTQPDLIIKRRR